MPHRKKASRASAKNIKSIIPSVHTSDPHYNDRPSSEESDAGSDNALEAQRAKVEFLHSPHWMSNLLIMVLQKHKTGLHPSVYTGHAVRWIVCQKFNGTAKAQSIQDFNPKSFVDYFIVSMYFYYNNIMTLSDLYINQKKWK